MSFVRSQRGAPLLTMQGFIYRCERNVGDRSYWLCIRYKKVHCNGRLILQGNEIVKRRSHNHDPDWTRIDRSVVEYHSLSGEQGADFLNGFRDR